MLRMDTALQMPAVFVGLAFIIFLIVWVVVSWKQSSNTAAQTFSALLTGIAIVVAGYWYTVERRGTPHADMSQTLTVVGNGSPYAIVESSIAIKNLGLTLLELSRLDLRLQSLDVPDSALGQIAGAGFSDWPRTFANGTPMYNGTELQWPTIKYFAGPVTYSIEPGETDVITSTFVVPCTLRHFRVAAEVTRTGGGDLVWKARSFGDTIAACSPKEERKP